MASGVILAIDPGEKYCGLCMMAPDGSYNRSNTIDPKRLKSAFWMLMSNPDRRPGVVVVELFQLYPWKMQEQGFSELETVKVIGVLEWIAEQFGYTKDNGKLVMQPAYIKKVTEARLRGQGQQWQLAGMDRHAKDAALHAWYYYLRQQEVENG